MPSRGNGPKVPAGLGGLLGHRALDARDQFFLVEGLGVERDGARGQRGIHHAGIRVRADEDEGKDDAGDEEAMLQVDAAHSRHAHVRDQAGAFAGDAGIEESFRGAERANRVAQRAPQRAHRAAHGGVVVDDGDQVVHFYEGWVAACVDSSTWNVVPRGMAGAAHMRPPCASTMVLEMYRPIPVPCGLVVKYASKTRSAWAGSIPHPLSVTETRMVPLACWRVRISSWASPRARPAIASTALMITLRSTCCSATRSPITCASGSCSAQRTTTCSRSSSPLASASTSCTSSFTSSGTGTCLSCWNMPLILVTMWPVRRASSTICWSASRASAISGTPRSSQRSAASPLAMTAASGWRISWAMEALIAESMVRRATWASSCRASARRFSASRRSVMSRIVNAKPMTPSAARTGDMLIAALRVLFSPVTIVVT